MSERYSYHRTDSHILTMEQYGTDAPNVSRRWNVYDLATTPFNFDEVLREGLDLNGDERILDVGCGDATLLRDMRQVYRHRGQLIAMDLFHKVLADTMHEARHEGVDDIYFVTGNAERLPFADDSIDVLSSLFVLYHVNDIEAALEEMKRVVIPNGKILIATSGIHNKQRQRQIELDIAEYLGIAPPPIFAASFNSEVADQLLPQRFRIERHFKQFGNLRINNQANYETYRDGLTTMRGAFDPTPTDEQWQAAIDNVLIPTINHDIDAQELYIGSGGQTHSMEYDPQSKPSRFFTDTVDRDFYICINDQ